MQYRIDKEDLLNTLISWNSFLKKKVHLIACGGTALTLLGIKASTKDIDLLVPNLDEYEYLIKILKQLGYKSVTGWGFSKDNGFVFDIFRGKKVHTTELLDSPLNNNILIKELSHIYLGVLNYYDLIISKIFRSTQVDIEDCVALLKNKQRDINLNELKERFYKTASFDIAEDRVIKNLEHFLKLLKKSKITDEE